MQKRQKVCDDIRHTVYKDLWNKYPYANTIHIDEKLSFLAVNTAINHFGIVIYSKDYSIENVMDLLLNENRNVFNTVVKPYYSKTAILDLCHFLSVEEKEYYRLKYA